MKTGVRAGWDGPVQGVLRTLAGEAPDNGARRRAGVCTTTAQALCNGRYPAPKVSLPWTSMPPGAALTPKQIEFTSEQGLDSPALHDAARKCLLVFGKRSELGPTKTRGRFGEATRFPHGDPQWGTAWRDWRSGPAAAAVTPQRSRRVAQYAVARRIAGGAPGDKSAPRCPCVSSTGR